MEKLKQILTYYGMESQIIQCIEEMSELTKALCKFTTKDTVFGIVEEIADVEVMLEQMKIIFKCHEEVDAIKEAKIERELERINSVTL